MKLHSDSASAGGVVFPEAKMKLYTRERERERLSFKPINLTNNPTNHDLSVALNLPFGARMNFLPPRTNLV